MDFNKLIEDEISSFVKKSNNKTKYRKPLIGFAYAKNPEFEGLKDVAAANHFIPSDLLPDAQSVISFFIPFTEDLININKNHSYISREWAVAYVETNKLIDEIIEHMKEILGDYKVKCSDNPARMPFDKEILMHRWSQRHVAKICGLGSFGINNMLITASGCAGRYGSFIIDTPLNYNEPNKEEYCLYKRNGKCKVCVEACPTRALTVDNFDRHKCFAWLNGVNDFYSDLDECDCCGKCITVPCAFKIP